MNKKKLLVLVTLVLLFSVSQAAFAHTPILYVEDYHDGTIYVQGGFSDGSSAAGTAIYLVEDKKFAGDTSVRDSYLDKMGEESSGEEPELFQEKLIIYKTQLDDFSEAIIEKPIVNYKVVFAAGPGHNVIEEGPQLTDSEI